MTGVEVTRHTEPDPLEAGERVSQEGDVRVSQEEGT